MGYILFMPKNGKLPERATFFLMFVTVLLAAQFRSKRFAEYFPPFAILFAAFSWQAFLIPNVLQLPKEFMDEIAPYLDKKKSEREETYQLIKQAAAVVLGIFFAVVLFYNIRGMNVQWWFLNINQEGLMQSIAGNEANTRYERAMNWLNENVPPGERIYNVNWDDFPKMFFYDQKHSYVWGLDPNYLYTQNPELYKRINDINNGSVSDPAPEIRDKFGARYIFSDARENQDMLAKALDSGWCEIAYDDDEAIILKIRDTKGEPLDPADDSPDDAPPDDEPNSNDRNDSDGDDNDEQ
jgi:hypothetical protein